MSDFKSGVSLYGDHPLYENRPVAEGIDPLGTTTDVVFNAGYDIGDTYDGLKTMGSAISARLYQGIPGIDNGGMQPLLRPSDIGTMGQMGGAIVDSYKQSYVDPVMQGRPLDIVKHFIAHPVNAVLDINALGQAGKLPQLAKSLANKSGAIQGAMAGAQEIKDSLLNKAGAAVQDVRDANSFGAGTAVADAVDQVAPVTPIGKKAAEISKSFTEGMTQEQNGFLNDVGRAWNKIPPSMRNHVQAYAEGWHPDLYTGKSVPPQVQAYLDKAEQYSKIMRERIGQYVDPADLSLEKYQPAAIKRMHMTTDDWKALSREEQLGVLEMVKDDLESRGIKPQYSPHVGAAEADSTIRNPTRIPNNKSLKGKSFLKTKQTAGEKAIQSHFDSMHTRWIQIAQFQQAYEKILQACIDASENIQTLKNAPDLGANQMAETAAKELADKGYEAMKGADLAESVLGGLKGAVLSEEELAYLAEKLIPETVHVPSDFKKALDMAMKQRSFESNPMLRSYDKLIQMSKRYMLGGNLTYGPAQLIQGMAMLEFVSMNGPRSTITHVLSYGLALQKSVRAAVPLHIADDILTATVSTNRYLENTVDEFFKLPVAKATPNALQAPLKGMVSAFENYIDFNLRVGSVCDSFVRAKAGIAEALLLSQETTPIGQAMREMFDSGKAAQLVEQAMNNPAQQMAIAKKVNNALLDFKEIANKPGMKMLGRITPFPSWLVGITKYTASLPVNHPYKTLMLNNIAQLQQEFVADPDVPSYLKGSVAIGATGPNGNPLAMRKEGMNPLTSVDEILGVVQKFMTGEGDASLPGMLPAPLQWAFMRMTRLNTMNLKRFDDPSLVKSRDGKQWKPEDVEAGRVASGEAKEQEPLPDDISLALRQVFPVTAKQFETILEKMRTGGQKSQMTTLFHSAPKLNKDGSIKPAADWFTLAVQQILNIAPLEYDPNAQMMEEKNNQLRQRELEMQLMRRDMNQ